MSYIRRPIIVEAFQMTRERRGDNSEWPQWLHVAWNKSKWETGYLGPVDYPNSDGTDMLKIKTPEGDVIVEWDDFIVKGIKGELRPLNPNIFNAQYDLLK